MQQFSFNPDRDIFIERYFENLQRQKKNLQTPQALWFIIESPLYKGMYQLLSDKLESMEIKTPSGFNDKPLDVSK